MERLRTAFMECPGQLGGGDVPAGLREEEPERLPRKVPGRMGQALTQLNDRDAMALRQTCGTSPLQISRMAHASKPHGMVFPAWLNRHACRSDGDMRGEAGACGHLGGDRRSA